MPNASRHHYKFSKQIKLCQIKAELEAKKAQHQANLGVENDVVELRIYPPTSDEPSRIAQLPRIF